ncbi:diacylglycerol kinase family protein [Aestuariibacter sp. AA17]|uniref:Diacylglycerol kinase family protein n=1 Tax=Fluctibacter corallii TaxID=2984329 RepID=A0ABT3A908_9ALTE|nr:diacylglycerol kinase family protein [Aestuariibacter sp. AA17]MCV2885153.1 diacylglycerol kinase family protein [Aestuariibacter sp. AA17]
MAAKSLLKNAALHYLLGASLALGIGIALFSMLGLWFIGALMVWTACALGIVSAAYFFSYGRLFRKRHDGRIPIWAKVVFLPFFIGIHIYNRIARFKDGTDALHKITDGLYLARRITPLDIPLLIEKEIGGILDVTAEFDALQFTAYELEVDYLNIPVLDHDVPSESQLIKALNWIHQHRRKNQNVIVHCALGKGRSGITVLAYMAMISKNQPLEDVVEYVQQQSERFSPNKKQMRWLERLHSQEKLAFDQHAYLIVNPVSGGGKWDQYKLEILSVLEAYLDVTIHETKENESLEGVVNDAISQGANLIIAAGGDGTLTAVAEALIDKDITFGVIPLGTANALCQVLLGAEFYTQPIEASCKAIIEGHTQTIDVAKCNGKLSLLMVGLGFEQRMIAYADRDEKNHSGVGAYLQGFFHAVGENEAFEATLTCDDLPSQTIKTVSLVAANAAPFTSVLAQGGGRPDLTDGQLDLTWLEATAHPISNIANLMDLWSAGASESSSSGVGHQRAKTVKIETSPPQDYVIDGELVGKTPITVETLPASLRILVSNDSEVSLKEQ